MKTTEELKTEEKTFFNNVETYLLEMAENLGEEPEHPEVTSPLKLIEKLDSTNISYDIVGCCWYYRRYDADAIIGPLVVLKDKKYATTIDYVDGCMCMGQNFYEAALEETHEIYEDLNNLILVTLDDRIDPTVKWIEIEFTWSRNDSGNYSEYDEDDD